VSEFCYFHIGSIQYSTQIPQRSAKQFAVPSLIFFIFSVHRGAKKEFRYKIINEILSGSN